MLTALSFTSRVVQKDGAWPLRVLVVDDYGVPSADVPVITVVDPAEGTSTPTVESTACPGVYVARPPVAALGRWTATAVHPDHGAVSWVAQVVEVTPTYQMPTADDVTSYMGDHSYTDEQVTEMLRQETAAQFRVCRVPAAYPADLRGAVLRRTQRALALLALPLAVSQTVDGESQMVVPGNDPEVRRLERPWRRLAIG